MFHSSHHHYPNSNHKIGSGKNNSITIRGPKSLRDIVTFKLISIYIPHTYYSFNSNNNTLIIRKQGDIDRIFTISPGDYSFNDLKTLLESPSGLQSLAGPPQTYTITEETPYNNKLVITQNSSSFIIRSTGTANLALGFSTSSDTSDLISQIGIHSYDLSYTKHIKLYCKQLTSFYTRVLTGGLDSSNLLAYIPVNSIYGGIIEYKPSTDMVFDCKDWNSDSNMTFTLLDDQDKPLGGLDSLNNRDWYMHISYQTHRRNHPHLLQNTTHRYSGNGGGNVYNL